jgi:hypothetical protein
MAPRRNEKAQAEFLNKWCANSHYQKNGTRDNQIKKSNSPETTKNHANQRLTVDDWAKRLEEHIGLLSQNQREAVFQYWVPIQRGINDATKDDALYELENFDQLKESLGYNLLIKDIPYILSKQPSKNSVYLWAKKLAGKRKFSWMASLIRQREAIRVMPKSYRLVFSEDGSLSDISLTSAGWQPQINPPNYNCDPENFLLNKEIFKMILFLPSIVGALNRKRAKEYQRILELQLSGVDVRPHHGKQLEIPETKVTSIKWQAFKHSNEIFVTFFPNLEQAQALYRAQKGKTWHVEKSNSKDRNRLYRGPFRAARGACTSRY